MLLVPRRRQNARTSTQSTGVLCFVPVCVMVYKDRGVSQQERTMSGVRASTLDLSRQMGYPLPYSYALIIHGIEERIEHRLQTYRIRSIYYSLFRVNQQLTRPILYSFSLSSEIYWIHIHIPYTIYHIHHTHSRDIGWNLSFILSSTLFNHRVSAYTRFHDQKIYSNYFLAYQSFVPLPSKLVLFQLIALIGTTIASKGRTHCATAQHRLYDHSYTTRNR